jgi:spore maturation protein B
MGSAETTFYVLAVYLGAVGIKRTRYLVPVCVFADLVGIIIAISIVKFFFP